MKSYEHNTYFIIQLPETALEAILSNCVEKTVSKARVLFDGSYVVKLPMNVAIPSILQNKTAYNHDEILIEIAKREIGRPEI